MYIKPSTPLLRSDQNAKAVNNSKRNQEDTGSFSELLEEIDVVELSSEVDPDEKRRNNPQNSYKNPAHEEKKEPHSLTEIPQKIDRIV